MKRHAFWVGTFLLLTVVLIVVGILTLNKSSLFTQRHQAMVYFGGSVKGLYIGAPVTFRGVKMGEVTHIGVEVDPRTLITRIPVRLTLSTDTLQLGRAGEPAQAVDLPELVSRGLRARLILQSIVTGQTAVELDFKPETPGVLVAGNKAPLPEIPTVQDKLDALLNQVQSLPLGDLVAELRQTMATLDQTLKVSQTAIQNSSKQLRLTGEQARQTMQAAEAALTQVQTQANLTLTSIQQLSDTSRQTLQDAQPGLRQTLTASKQAAEEAQRAMRQLADFSAPGSTLRTDLSSAAQDLSQAARTMRSFADQLDADPSSLLFGRSQP
ncbi:MAG: MlaD family protein [Aquabacterium sp.]|uniref:MlaD family protein n=1 Tax=Aquabacterium sp. TaxID=1872578 RepID=UPI003BE29C95